MPSRPTLHGWMESGGRWGTMAGKKRTGKPARGRGKNCYAITKQGGKKSELAMSATSFL